MASVLLSPISLRGVTIPNRIAVSPMCQYNSTDGSANDWHLMHIGQFVLGGFGLIIAEMTNVNPVGRITHKCAGLYSDDNEKALKRVVDFARQYGNSKLGLQVGHAGRKGSTKVPALGGTPLGKDEGAWETVAPSAIPYDPSWHVPRAMTKDEMKATLDDYVSYVQRAERVGYDLLELHAAHGYLLHQFLSPLSNQRSDEYGGSLEKRMRYPLEVFAAIRAAWPKDKPLGIRVSAVDWVDGGTTIEDTVKFAHELKALGCDYMDVSSGQLELAAEDSLRAGLQCAVQRTGEEGNRVGDHVGRPHHRRQGSGRYRRVRQGGHGRARARRNVRPALADPRGGGARCRAADRAAHDAGASQAAPDDLPELQAGGGVIPAHVVPA